MSISVFDPDDWPASLDTLEEDFSELRLGGGFTAAEIQAIANATVDYYLHRSETFRPAGLHERPVWEKFSAKKETFPGGIELAVLR